LAGEARVIVVNFTFIKKNVHCNIDRAEKNQMTKSSQCIFILVTGILLSFILTGCSSNGASDEGELFIKVLDAPAAFQQMNIVVDRVSIHRAGAAADVGWTIASTNSSGAFDLLNLRNGRNLQLALSKVPVGTYDHIKITYGACTIINNSLEQLLIVDSTSSSIAYGFQIVEGKQLQLTFDYDAYRSVFQSGGRYFFKPVIRVQNTSLSGSIVGSVLRPDTLPNVSSVHTFTGLDSVTTLIDPNGSFQISDLPENMYAVTILSGDPAQKDTTITNINVVRNQVSNIGAITLRKK
jgi:hypothetical protein